MQFISAFGDSSEESENEETLLDHLNRFLKSRGVSPVRHRLTKQWTECTERTKRAHTRKAQQGITAILEEIAPSDPGAIWNSVSKSQTIQQRFPSVEREKKTHNLDITLLDDALTECYNGASNWQTRRQILSIIADKVDFPTLQKWLPDLMRYRYNVAMQTAFLNPWARGRGDKTIAWNSYETVHG